MSALSPVKVWVSQLKDGDPIAAQQLWDAYFLRMVKVARGKLQGAFSRMADEEDVALSAFKSFCRGARDGRFPQLLEHEDPWPLLMALTTHKAIDLMRHERRVKRGGPGLRPSPFAPAETAAKDDEGLSRVIASEPNPATELELAEDCQYLLDRLSDTILRAIALWKMEGFTTDEIADKLGCVPRTVERKLQVIRKLWYDRGDPR
jgi:DNA-directed RNA polymerase specialized sigma24 family protein